MRFTGLFVPLITPFTAADEIAADALAALAHEVLDAGAAGLVALGTTGEPANLTAGERRRVLDICASICREHDVPLIVGAGSHTTADSVRALTGLDARAAAALTSVPYYLRPSEEGVLAHFRALAAACPVPLLVYHIPYRTARPLSAETLCRIAELPNVAGFKLASGGIDDTVIEFLSRISADIDVLAGDDLYTSPLLALGASGAILACANVVPGPYAELIDAWRSGRSDTARRLGDRLVPLAQALFAEPNPVVLKAVLTAQGRIPTSAVRLPLLPATGEVAAAASYAVKAFAAECSS